jgi:hypothetical protein
MSGEYEHVAVSLDGNRLTIERRRGDFMPERLVWTRDSPVTKVTVDGVDAPFETDGDAVIVALNTLNERAKIQVE